MQRIIVEKNQLERKLAELRTANSKFIELCIAPGQIDGEEFNPAFLHFGCFRSDGSYEDHESIDECAVTCNFIRKSA